MSRLATVWLLKDTKLIKNPDQSYTKRWAGTFVYLFVCSFAVSQSWKWLAELEPSLEDGT